MDRADEFASSLRAGRILSPSDEVLLEEACRLIRRSDRFEALILGDLEAWATLRRMPNSESRYELVINQAISEARATVTELRQVVKVLIPQSAASSAEPGTEPAGDVPAGVVSILDRGGKRKGKRTG